MKTKVLGVKIAGYCKSPDFGLARLRRFGGSHSSGQRLVVGLLGGSFNPAHFGHLHLSQRALSLGIDRIWWLVSPQNPLKSTANLAPLSERVAIADSLVRNHRSITVTTVESEWQTRYSHDTVVKLQQQFPRIKFVWLMGADCLQNFHHWYKWQAFFSIIPILVFDRPNAPKSTMAAQRFAAAQKFGLRQLRNIGRTALPAWGAVHCRTDASSSTAIRNLTNESVPRR